MIRLYVPVRFVYNNCHSYHSDDDDACIDDFIALTLPIAKYLCEVSSIKAAQLHSYIATLSYNSNSSTHSLYILLVAVLMAHSHFIL